MGIVGGAFLLVVCPSCWQFRSIGEPTATQLINVDVFLQIVEVEQPFDRMKNQRRAFIFITYESEEIVEQVVANPKQMVGGKEVWTNRRRCLFTRGRQAGVVEIYFRVF